jgi:hypothetical protein
VSTAIQLDYGGFDPAFVGITTSFSTRRAWETFDSFLKSSDPIQPSSQSDDERFEWLAVTSAVTHEVRHFHDFLLSPYSARIFKLRVQAAINLIQLLPHLLDETANCIPVPLPVWCGLADQLRSRELSFLPERKSGEPWVPVKLPFIPKLGLPRGFVHGSHELWDKPVEVLLAAAAQAHERIREYTHNPRATETGVSLQPWQVFELSAVLIQIQDVWHTYGAEETEFFLNYLLKGTCSPYGAVLQTCKLPWDRRGAAFDTRIASAMAFWSMCGSYEKDGWSACPAVRFTSLLTNVASGKARASLRSELFALFDEWSDVTSLSSVNEGLDETARVYQKLMERVVELPIRFHEKMFSGDIEETVARVVGGVLESSQRMIACVRADPESYVLPDCYVSPRAANYVNPIVRHVFDGSGLTFTVPKSELEREGYRFEWLTTIGNREVVVSMIRPFTLSKHAYLKASDVSDYFTLVSLTDFLFARESRARRDVQLSGRSFFQKANLIPVELAQVA